jgi:CheY-like chemotaxis protein
MAKESRGKIFISYAKEDAQLATSLYFDLKRAGLDPWIDEHNILPGERWKAAIRRAVRESRYILALLSSRSVSKRGFVQQELLLALEERKLFPAGEIFLIPVRLDKCEPAHEQLKELQYVDLFPSYEAGLAKVLRVLGPDARMADKPASTSRRGRVLVVDDDDRWRDLLTQTLTQDGLLVRSASSLEEALELLSHDFFHLMITDLRLQEDNSGSQEGMLLLQKIREGDLRGDLHLIVLTAYARTDEVRRAFREFGVADFFRKQDFDDKELTSLVRRLLGREGQLNLDLILHWQGIEEPKRFISALQSKWPDIDRPPRHTLSERIADELEDLLGRLFFEADRVLVKPATRERGGQGLLYAQPVYANGVGRTVVVKVGEAEAIARERESFETYVQPLLGPSFVASLTGMRRTPMLGGIAYLPGSGAGERFEDFGAFYRRATVEQVQKIIDVLFLEALAPWYLQANALEVHDFSVLYGAIPWAAGDDLPWVFGKDIEIASAGEEIAFRSLGDRRLRNPLQVVAGGVSRPTYVSITHGNLGEQSILLDDRGSPWLINFSRTGPGHVLRDLVDLDSSIRIALLDPEKVGLKERLELEERLISAGTFEELQQLPSRANGQREVEKAFEVCRHLRSLAAKLLARNPSTDLGEVHLGLLYAALGLVRSADLQQVQRQHTLAAAGILAAKLGL